MSVPGCFIVKRKKCFKLRFDYCHLSAVRKIGNYLVLKLEAFYSLSRQTEVFSAYVAKLWVLAN